MSERITPPSWTEWTRNPSERSSQRKAFDDILGELRKEGLIEVKGSLFVHLARYSFLHVKNAQIDVRTFVQGVPSSVFGALPPVYRQAEADAMLKILEAAGLVTILEQGPSGLLSVLLTERKSAGEVARGQVVHSVLSYLRDVYARWDPPSLVTKPSSFPTPDSTSKSTGVDKAQMSPGEGCTAVQDRPESNETNPNPFLQETIDKGAANLVLLQLWPLPDPKSGSSGGGEPEMSLLIPADMSLASLVKDYCVPILGEYFRSNEHHDLATDIQAKYATYMHKYRERFSPGSGIVVTDKIDKVLTSSDIEGEAFANAAYVVSQVVKGALKEKVSSLRASNNPIVYQAARLAYAHAMALRVRKRRGEKDAAARLQDSALLVNRLKDSTRPLTVDDLKKTQDSTKNHEIGTKYTSVIDLLPLLPPKEGSRPPVFEIRGAFVHREKLVRTFLEIREREALAQRERLAQDWARTGIPPIEEVFLLERDLSADFTRVFELIHQERILAANVADFLRDYLPNEAELSSLARLLWPEGHRGAITPLEVLSRGLDPILYEDKDRLKRRALAGVLGLAPYYPQIVKSAWNIIFMEEGVFRFVLRKILAFFGGRPGAKTPAKEEPVKKAAAASGSGGGSGDSSASKPGGAVKRAADLKRLKVLAPSLQERDVLVRDREKMAAQWCLKLDKESARKTRETVDDEVFRIASKIPLEELAEENSAKVALYLIEKSPTLAQVTSSRAFHRYLYQTALLRLGDHLSR